MRAKFELENMRPYQIGAPRNTLTPRPDYQGHEGSFSSSRFYSKLRLGETKLGTNMTNAQRVKQREEALYAAKKAFLEERTIERLGAVIQAQVNHHEEVSKLLSETQGPDQIQ